MDELIERLERATGPDRELDGEIFKLVHEKPGDVWERVIDEVWHLQDPEDRVAWTGPRPYTASIDATLTLVPDGAWTLTRMDSGRYWAEVGDEPWQYEGATPALALCIAALKAHAPRS